MLHCFSIPCDIGCELDSLLFVPPSSGQLLGVHSVAAEEARGISGSNDHFIRSLSYSVLVLCSFLCSFSQTHSINSLSLMLMGYPLMNSSLQMVLPSPDDHPSPYFLGVGFASMQNAAMRSLGSFGLAE